MCLIIVSKEGQSPPAEILKRGYTRNPDGWGIMAADEGGRVAAAKGLTEEGFNEALPHFIGRPFAIHFRWATHGEKSTANCHPFKVRKDLRVMHNGILNVETSTNPAMSDTWHFTQMLKTSGLAPDNVRECLPEIEKAIGSGNKLVFLDGESKITIANEKAGFWEKGFWYSNRQSHWDYDDMASWEGYGASKYWTKKGASTTSNYPAAYKQEKWWKDYYEGGHSVFQSDAPTTAVRTVTPSGISVVQSEAILRHGLNAKFSIVDSCDGCRKRTWVADGYNPILQALGYYCEPCFADWEIESPKSLY